MKTKDKSLKELKVEVETLRAKLAEAEETLRAIRSGEVDALVVSGEKGEQVFTLKGAEQPYRVLIEEMNEGAAMLAADDSILYCNKGFAGMLKTPLEKLIGTGIANYIATSSDSFFLELLKQGREGRSCGEIKLLTGDGTFVQAQFSFNNLQTDEARFLYLVATDLTGQKLIQDELQKARDELEIRVEERTAELSKTNAALHDEVSERKRAEEAIILHDATLDGLNRILGAALACNTEEELGRACLQIAEQVTQSKFGFIGEINEKGLQDIAISNPGWDACITLNPGGHGRHIGSFAVHGIYGRVISDGKSLFVNDPAHHPDSIGIPPGHPPLDSFLGVPLIREGRTIGMIAVGNREGGYTREQQEALDAMSPVIVEALMSQRAETALRESEARFRSVLDNSQDVIYRVNAQTGRYEYISPSAEKVVGFSPGELMAINAETSLAMIHPHDLPAMRAVLARMEDTGKGELEYRQRTKNGDYRWISNHMSLVKDSAGRPLYRNGNLRDITDRKQVEEALQKAHDVLELRVRERTAEFEKANKALSAEIKEHKKAVEKIREQAALLDKSHDAIAVRDLKHHLTYWNNGAQRLYGWAAEEVIGKNADELLYKDKEKNTALVEAKKSALENGEWIGELHHLTKDDKEVIVESRWALVCNDAGKPDSILIINTDITEKKKIEAQLLRSQRMESIGTLAGGIAHDLNNMLTPIMLSLELLKEKFKDEQSQKMLAILERNSQRGADLLKQVLSFARGVEGERNPLQAKHIILEIHQVAKETFPRNIEIRTEILKDLFSIYGDATQLHQIIMNLCVNARDAMPGGGKLVISAENFFIDENYARMHSEATIGPYIVISVSDTGIGIPPKILDRIFEPFFTTKEFGKGTGLGLSTVLAIVKSHGGFVDVYSKVGIGTTFRVYLPAIETEMQNIEEQQLELLNGQGELVLVAEDEDSVRELTVLTLEKYGYNVLAANDGVEAVALYAQNMDKIKVILMDMMMPVMDGHASIRAIRKINPGVKVIAVSGLAEKDKLKNVVDYSNAFLPKPYTAERLLKAMHEVLSAK